MEIDPHESYPPDVDRDITDTWPEDGITMDVNKMLKARGIDPDESHA